MSYENSLKKINDALIVLKFRDEKTTQKNVAIQAGLSLRTVIKYWHDRDNIDKWYSALYRKIGRIKSNRQKVNIDLHNLKNENERLREQNRILALKALGLVAI